MICEVNEFITEYKKRYGDQTPIPKATPTLIDWLNDFTDRIYAMGRGDAMQHLKKLPKAIFMQWGEKTFFDDADMIEWISAIAYEEYCAGWEAGGGEP